MVLQIENPVKAVLLILYHEEEVIDLMHCCFFVHILPSRLSYLFANREDSKTIQRDKNHKISMLKNNNFLKKGK
jgi:hypothetical protein